MRIFRPQINVQVGYGYVGSYKNNMLGDCIQLEVSSYANVKKRMREFLGLSQDNLVRVYRQRRGQSGEWFELWAMVDGKPKIVKESWQ